MPKRWIRKDVDKRKKDSDQAHWSKKQKYQAVQQYLIYGTAPATAVATGIPLPTIQKWKVTPWWKEMEDEIRSARGAVLTTRLTKVADKALDALHERLDKGELYYDPKTETFRRVPVNAKTLSTIAKDAIDREMLLERMRREIPKEKTQNDINKRLDNVLDEFRKLARRPQSTQTIEGEIIDVQPIKNEDQREAAPLALEAQGEAEQTEGQV